MIDILYKWKSTARENPEMLDLNRFSIIMSEYEKSIAILSSESLHHFQ